MGQTLTHGIYLPDEGERNCYDGLAANWQLLDGAVGTVAEHTTQIAGKAPAVHTHTKADITDFPAYGNTAGTICEGNDSRLSDARTPVAHTHVTADVTDLLNGNHTWTGDNTFSQAVGFTKVNATTLYVQNSRAELGDSGLSGDPYNQIAFWDKNGDNFSYLRQTYNADGTNVLNIIVRNKFLNGVPNTAGTIDYAYFGIILGANKSKEAVFKANLRPYDSTNAYNLGDATYQWNNLYAKNYYYNGTAWGLDKANIWTGANTFSGATNSIIYLKFGTSGAYNDIRYYDNNNLNYATIRCQTNFLSLGVKHSLASSGWYNGSSLNVIDNGSVTIKSYDGTDSQNTYFTNNAIYPSVSSVTDLGTSTNKWKTLNGVNPGALSLPDTSRMSTIEIPSSWVWNGTTENSYTAPFTGWIGMGSSRATNVRLFNNNSKIGMTQSSEAGIDMRAYIPMVAGDEIKISGITSSSFILRVYQCLGNV